MQSNQGQGQGNTSQDVPPKGTPPPSQSIEGEEEDSKSRTGSAGGLPNQGSQQKSNLVGGGSSRT